MLVGIWTFNLKPTLSAIRTPDHFNPCKGRESGNTRTWNMTILPKLNIKISHLTKNYHFYGPHSLLTTNNGEIQGNTLNKQDSKTQREPPEPVNEMTLTQIRDKHFLESWLHTPKKHSLLENTGPKLYLTSPIPGDRNNGRKDRNTLHPQNLTSPSPLVPPPKYTYVDGNMNI